jgi:hypothetical protein
MLIIFHEFSVSAVFNSHFIFILHAFHHAAGEIMHICSDALYSELSGRKFDRQFWLGLSCFDCLRLDYKQVH